MNPSAVVCLSGGLDSCVTLAEALQLHDRVGALHLDYGQRTEARERAAFEAICDHFSVEDRLLARQPALVQIGASALVDPSIAVPETDSGDEIPITYVPFRNGQILSLAVAWAEALGAREVWLGAVEEDGSGYPDCREEFFRRFEAAVRAGTRPESGLRIVTPVLALDKAGIVRRAVELRAPVHLSWSCYQSEDRPCGRCESCRLRARGFERAGVSDPLLG
jgi:7-cyano-7-deazaguanine synthase